MGYQNNVPTGSRNIDEANEPKDERSKPLTCQLERTGDTSPPSSIRKPSCMTAFVSSSKQRSYHRFSAYLILSVVGRRDTRLIDAPKTLWSTGAKRHSDIRDPRVLFTDEKAAISRDYLFY